MTDTAYQILSDIDVDALKAAFEKKLASKAAAALPPDAADDGDLLVRLKNLLWLGVRKRIDIHPANLADLAAAGAEAVAGVMQRAEDKTPFSRPDDFIKAAARRRETPEVMALFGNRQRLYFRFDNDHTKLPPTPEHATIAKYLQKKGYAVTDYIGGYATDAKGKQKFRIAKLLQEDKKLSNMFMNDGSRMKPAAGEEFLIALSRDIDDVKYMSTNRKWSSCLSANGQNKRHLPCEVGQGTLVAYLINAKDPEILNPYVRILLKPFVRNPEKGIRKTYMDFQDGAVSSYKNKIQRFFNKQAAAMVGRLAPSLRQDHGDVIFVTDGQYGLRNYCFENAVRKIADDHFNKDKQGDFRMAGGAYNDLPRFVTRTL